MEKFFSVFGKVMLVILILGLIGGGAYYFGTKNNQKSQLVTTPMPTAQPTEVISNTPTTALLLSPPGTTSSTGRTSLSAGVPQFGLYVLSYPAGWSTNEQRDDKAGTDIVTLTKNGYTLKIVEAGSGGGTCVFGNETPQPFSQHFNTYVDIAGTNGVQYRRGQTDDTNYTICEKTSDGSYKFPTSWGPITYVTQVPTVSSILAEMDSIVSSILKQH